MAKKRSVCPYTPEGRIGLHDNLRVNTKPLLELMRQPLYNGSAEYADNRLSLFSAQWGRCAVTGAEFTATSDIHCHHKKLKSNGGSDKYENLVLVLEPVHKLIHAQKPETIAHYLEVLNLNPAQLEKVNGLRKQAGILEIKSEPCKGTQNEIYNTYSLRQKG
jgi:RNA-directed DNA polymerase